MFQTLGSRACPLLFPAKIAVKVLISRSVPAGAHHPFYLGGTRGSSRPLDQQVGCSGIGSSASRVRLRTLHRMTSLCGQLRAARRLTRRGFESRKERRLNGAIRKVGTDRAPVCCDVRHTLGSFSASAATRGRNSLAKRNRPIGGCTYIHRIVLIR